jgi:transposase-like protein
MRQHIPKTHGQNPKGVVRVNETMRAVYRDRVAGATCAELARKYGVAAGTIQKWTAAVREAKADEAGLR